MQPAPDPHELTDRLHLVFQASPSGVRDSLARMLAEPPLRDLIAEDRGTAELVLAEVLNNVVEHAYAARPGPVAVTLTRVVAGTRCLVSDQGAAMPGGVLPEGRLPETDVALVDLPEGGFGWHLVRCLTLDLRYDRLDGSNRLSFVLPRTA